jgi:hypothetical protein
MAPQSTCRHCHKPILLFRPIALWYHADRPVKGAAWCSTNPNLQNAYAEPTAAPVDPRPGPLASR